MISEKRAVVPSHIASLKPYVAGKTIKEVVDAYHPDNIAKLASNENRLGCSPKVKEAAARAVEIVNDYPDSAAIQLRTAIAEKYGLGIENVVCGAGLEGVISLLMRTFVGEGEHTLTGSVTFAGWMIHAHIHGVETRQVPMTSDYRFDLDALADAINENTKMVYIANPNNPTGTIITKAEFEAFMTKVPSDVLVIMDEAYYEFAQYEEGYPNSLDYKFDNVITLRTFSKAYGLAGFRVGYAMGPKVLIAHLLKAKLTFEPGVVGQAAAVAALGDMLFLMATQNMVSAARKRLQAFFDSRGVDYVPTYANAVMMILPTAEEAAWFNEEMLKRGVILRRLAGFGLPNGIRVTVGTDEQMTYFEESFDAVMANR